MVKTTVESPPHLNLVQPRVDMDINAIYGELTTDASEPSIKASWIERFLDSPITFWCDVHAPEEMRDAMELFQEHLFESCQEHQ